jgi:hypothetical protein
MQRSSPSKNSGDSPVKSFFIAAALLLGVNTDLRAACATLIKGPVAVDVLQCNTVNPEQAFPLTDSKYNFIRDLPPVNRAPFLDTYRGLLIRGTVARSFAVRSGLSDEQGALGGERILAYIPPKLTTCQAIQSKRIQAYLDEVCCEGGGTAPCLLGSSYVLKKPQLVNASNAPTPQGSRQTPDQLAAYRQAATLMSKRDYRNAIGILEKLRNKQNLDIQGNYLLGLAYRESDRCAAAVPFLEAVYSRFERNDFWSDEEIYVRRGTLLLARCYAMMNRGGEAVMILQAFLVEPKKYQKEIAESLSHPDFGYIRTDKNFIDYRNSATRAQSK